MPHNGKTYFVVNDALKSATIFLHAFLDLVETRFIASLYLIYRVSVFVYNLDATAPSLWESDPQLHWGQALLRPFDNSSGQAPFSTGVRRDFIFTEKCSSTAFYDLIRGLSRLNSGVLPKFRDICGKAGVRPLA
jgi:hypothetical protein